MTDVSKNRPLKIRLFAHFSKYEFPVFYAQNSSFFNCIRFFPGGPLKFFYFKEKENYHVMSFKFYIRYVSRATAPVFKLRIIHTKILVYKSKKFTLRGWLYGSVNWNEFSRVNWQNVCLYGIYPREAISVTWCKQ